MKLIITACFIFVQLSYLSSQTTIEKQIFANTQGIKHSEITFYESEGTNIFVEEVSRKLNEKTIKKLKRKYKIEKNLPPLKDEIILEEHVFYEVEEVVSNKLSALNRYYFFPKGNEHTQIIGFRTHLARDTILEKLFIENIRKDKIPDSIYTEFLIDTIPIKFVNKEIKLGPLCHWMNTHNLQCPGLGQISWSEFRNEERAKQSTNAQIESAMYDRKAKLIARTEIDVLFLDHSAKAQRYEYEIQVPKILLLGSSNKLIIYYITNKINDKFVSCVLSHYSDQKVLNGELPQLLTEVLELK